MANTNTFDFDGSGFLVRGADGAIDQTATLAKVGEALVAFAALDANQSSDFAKAIDAVFDAHPGVRIPLPALANEAMKSLNVDVMNYQVISERVQTFVRNNSGDRETGRKYGMSKGKGGGVGRWSDIPVEKPATTPVAAATAPVAAPTVVPAAPASAPVETASAGETRRKQRAAS